MSGSRSVPATIELDGSQARPPAPRIHLEPPHTHFVDLVEPVPPVVPSHWELGLSDSGETTDLH